ncbi:MAG: hypothetical protein ACYDAN_02945 [Candidatus Limnocylindrales bacterium]
MSPSEIGFLALGLVVGITAGALLLAVVRPRSPFRPVVRVTVTPHAMAPRERLAIDSPRPHRFAQPVPGSPDEDAHMDLPAGLPISLGPSQELRAWPAEIRTRVPSGPGISAHAVGIPIAGGGGQLGNEALASATGELAVAVAERAVEAGRGQPTASGLPSRIDIRPARADLSVRARPPVTEHRPALSAEVVGIPILARGPARGSAKGSGARAAAEATAVDPCADARAKSSSACAEADTAREAARALADRLREAQRALSDLQARVEEAGSLADPRRLAAEKDRLHAQFRAAHAAAQTTDDAEEAARAWLTDVSAANTAARDAARRVQAGTDELRVQAAAHERLDLEANAARVAAERSEADCRSARESLATCEERQRAAAPAAEEPAQDPGAWPGGAEPTYDARPTVPADRGGTPVILRVLRGDAAAREQLVATLAGDDGHATAAWHVRIAKLIDAITARAIEDGYLDVDEEHPFWRLFSGEEQREIVLALSALGFRYDGMRGFDDDRAPSARDLSLAVGYAGLDRMRVRVWPGDSALAALFDGAVVRADLWLAYQADDLSLARIEAALGPRAAALGEVWDAWGRVRPAMLEDR